MHAVFAEWNEGDLDSYLIEITRDILGIQGRGRRAAGGQDPRHRRPERDRQVDGHFNSADLGIPITLIAEAVYSRCVRR
jgi:6-phosphogluconate dehydrogenase